MNHVHRITIGTVLLVPIVAAALVTGFPAKAAGFEQTPLSDPRVGSSIDRSVKQNCRDKRRGSVEHSVCLAEGRKDAYRAAADARRGAEKSELSLR